MKRTIIYENFPKKFILALLLLLVLFVQTGVALAQENQEKPTTEPERVIVGAHINDVQEIDLKTHSYRLDFYVWFRWKNPEIDPAASVEFMNAFEQEDHVRTKLYEEPQKMPDGSLYMVVRERGKFSTKFPLHQFPFDHQQLSVIMEDSVYDESKLVYIPDTTTKFPVTVNPNIYIPGFTVDDARLDIGSNFYDTTFGDLNYQNGSKYSRAFFVIPIQRPQISIAIKIFLPVVLILVCCAMVYFVHPIYVEGRLGVAITALLTLVALQLTTGNTLPEVDYMMLTDKIYILSYLFIIATMWQVVKTSARVQAEAYDKVRISNLYALGIVILLFSAGVVIISWSSFSPGTNFGK